VRCRGRSAWLCMHCREESWRVENVLDDPCYGQERLVLLDGPLMLVIVWHVRLGPSQEAGLQERGRSPAYGTVTSTNGATISMPHSWT